MMSQIRDDNVPFAFTFRERPSSANPQPIITDELGDKNRFKKYFQKRLQQRAQGGSSPVPTATSIPDAGPPPASTSLMSPNPMLDVSAASPRPLSPAPLGATLSRQASLDDPEQAIKDALPATITKDQLVRLAGTRELATAESLVFQLDLSDTACLEAVGSHCPELKCLVLDESMNFGSFRDLGPGLRSLEKLSLAKSGVTELDGIGILENLRELQLAHNEVQDLTPLFMHETLQVLGLGGNKVADLRAIEVLATCPVLYSLDLRKNPVAQTLPCFREVVAHHIPQLRVLDGHSVTPDEGQGLDDEIMVEIHKAVELRQSVKDGLSPKQGEHDRPPGVFGRYYNGEPAADEDDDEELDFEGASHLTLGHTVFAGNFSKSLRDRRLKGVGANDRTLDILSTLDQGLQLPASKELLEQWRSEVAKGSVAVEGSIALQGKHRLDPLAQEDLKNRHRASRSPKRKGKHRLHKKQARPNSAPESPPGTRSPLRIGPGGVLDFGFTPNSLASRTWSPQQQQAARSQSSDYSSLQKNVGTRRRPHTAQAANTSEGRQSPTMAWGFTPRAGESAPAGGCSQPNLLFALDWSNSGRQDSGATPATGSSRESMGVVRPSTAGSSFWGDSMSEEQTGLSARDGLDSQGGSHPKSRGAYGIAAQKRAYRSRTSGIPVVGDATDSDSSQNSESDSDKRTTRDNSADDSGSDDSDIEVTRRNMKKLSLTIAKDKGTGDQTPRKLSAKGLPPRPQKPAFQRRGSRADEVGKQMGFDLLSSLAAIDEWIDHTVSSASEEDSDLVPVNRDQIIARVPTSGDLSTPPRKEVQPTVSTGNPAISPSENNYFDEEENLRSPKKLQRTGSGMGFPTHCSEGEYPAAEVIDLELPEAFGGDVVPEFQSSFAPMSPSHLNSFHTSPMPNSHPRTPKEHPPPRRNPQTSQRLRGRSSETPEGSVEAKKAEKTEPKQQDATKLAISLPDDVLIEMLQKPPKTVPEMRTKDRFRAFFSGFPASRLPNLLMCAFDDLDPEEQAKKVKKRIKMVEDVLGV